jgi:1-acyl-sn-glycerol-3-phosphate acyltransferase
MKFLKKLLFLFIIRPLVYLFLGLNLRGRENLPKKGPAVLVANHNSHLDALLLMALFPIELLPHIHPVGAADYFLGNKILRWLSVDLLGMIPIRRGISEEGEDPFVEVKKALNSHKIIIFFPEGTRGEPEKFSPLKSGISYLAGDIPDVPIIPIYLQGLGKALPKDSWVIVPFVANAVIGTCLTKCQERARFMEELQATFDKLSAIPAK